MQSIKKLWSKSLAGKIAILLGSIIALVLVCFASLVFLVLIFPDPNNPTVPSPFAPVVAVFATIIAIVFIVLFVKKARDYKKLYARFKDTLDIENEQKRAQREFEKAIKNFDKEKRQRETEERRLKESYQKKRAIYKNLLREVDLYEEELEMISFGLYKPHFGFDTSERFKQEITRVRQEQRAIVRARKAAICTTDWAVAGSKAEGRKMINRNIKLMLRAFNNECDAAVLKVRWNNIERMESRITKAFDAINKLGEPTNIYITRDYLKAKLKELYLTHEYQEKRRAEKEEQREIQAQIREEQRVLREAEKAKKEAELEEKRQQEALEKARKELGVLRGEDLARLQEKISALEKDLKEVQERKERAISRAQMTRAGHVYVISNIGSFGEGVYKIGMTRRLEPMDRVKELGDASVPFTFDVHAIIYSEDAPSLEKSLHAAFDKKRLNLVNSRKEFFRVSLEEIEAIVHQKRADIEFTKIAEAREYKETMSILEKEEMAAKRKAAIEEKFPDTL